LAYVYVDTMSVADFERISIIVAQEEDKFKTFRNVIRTVNLRSDPRPSRPIPHFTSKTYELLEQFRKKMPIDSMSHN
jgi:hypothetical protein